VSPAYFDSGFSVREASWHKMEKILDYWPDSWDIAWKEANGGKPWEIEVAPAYWFDGDRDGFVQTDSKFIMRDKEILYTAGKEYTPIANWEYGEVIQQVMEALGQELKYETTVVLHKGRIIASTMYLPHDIEVPHDPSPMRLYVVFFTSHNASNAFKFGKSHVRIVCWNTQQAAENELDRTGNGFLIKHTTNWKDRLETVLGGIKTLRGESFEFLQVVTDLSTTGVSSGQVNEFVDKWIPYSTDMGTIELANVHKRRARFHQILNDSTTTDGIRGYKWGVYQAAVELCDHFTRSRSIDTEIKRQLLTGDDRKATALKILQKV
jgi:phage/plasmid-like protein (TIGR03299 family)